MAPLEAPFGGHLQRALIGRTFLDGLLFVHSSANKGPFVEGLLWEAHTEGPFVGAE